MQYLRIKKGKNLRRADGSPKARPLVMRKNRKYGEVLSEQSLSLKRPVLVTGEHDSGKTRWLERLHAEAEPIWGAKIKATPLWLATFRPISAWTDVPHLAQWWNQGPGAESDEAAARPWSKLKAWERVDALPLYCEATGAVVFLDDAHKLSGRKLDIARRCIMAANIWVASSSQENRLPPSLRRLMLNREPQTYRLNSEVAYDATTALMWLMMAVAMGLGAWEISAVLGGLKLLGSGRKASRQD